MRECPKREGDCSRVAKAQVMFEEEEEETKTHVRAWTMAMKLCAMKTNQASPEWIKEPQEDKKHELGVKLAPTKIDEGNSNEGKGTRGPLKGEIEQGLRIGCLHTQVSKDGGNRKGKMFEEDSTQPSH